MPFDNSVWPFLLPFRQKGQRKMKQGICMRLQCDECKVWHDIPEDKYNDYNIYRKWDGTGSALTSPPILLCPKCSKIWAAKARK